MGLKLAVDALLLHRDRALAALGGVTALSLAACYKVSDAVIARLPPMLRALNVAECMLTDEVSFVHLPALESLDCSSTEAVEAGLARLPPSLRKLRMQECKLPDTADFSHLWQLREVACGGRPYELSSASVASLPPSLEVLDVSDVDYESDDDDDNYLCGWSLAHLTRLRVLNASCTVVDDAAIATLPPSLQVLNLEGCNHRLAAASFAHLPCLHTLSLCSVSISSAALATLPPSLVSLDLDCGDTLTAATVFPNLPALRALNVSSTSIGDAAVASMPASLEELSMVRCRNVTQRASLDHLVALRVLQSVGTNLSLATMALHHGSMPCVRPLRSGAGRPAPASMLMSPNWGRTRTPSET